MWRERQPKSPNNCDSLLSNFAAVGTSIALTGSATAEGKRSGSKPSRLLGRLGRGAGRTSWQRELKAHGRHQQQPGQGGQQQGGEQKPGQNGQQQGRSEARSAGCRLLSGAFLELKGGLDRLFYVRQRSTQSIGAKPEHRAPLGVAYEEREHPAPCAPAPLPEAPLHRLRAALRILDHGKPRNRHRKPGGDPARRRQV